MAGEQRVQGKGKTWLSISGTVHVLLTQSPSLVWVLANRPGWLTSDQPLCSLECQAHAAIPDSLGMESGYHSQAPITA